MNEKRMLLISSIRNDLTVIHDLFATVPDVQIVEQSALLEDEDALIVLAYRLHNLYNAFENIFENIAAHFENSIDERGRWHAQLLERMRLNAMPLRPAVIDDDAYEALDELRRFRHLFRHAYSIQLDPYRLDLVVRKANILRAIYQRQLEQFIGFVQHVGNE